MKPLLSHSSSTLKLFLALIQILLIARCQTPVGTDCIFKDGEKMNCREYCGTYFNTQPQLGWYNLTSQKCEPLKWCSWVLHFYDYATNECYTDATMKTIAPSEYPETLIENRIATFYIDRICVNGVPETGIFSDASCYCYFLWEDSGKVDMNGYSYKCDQVVGPQKWNGYFFKETLKSPNGSVIMYGQYTPEQLQVVYEQMKQKETEQTNEFVYKYEESLLSLIQKQLAQQSLIRDHETIWFVLVFVFIYLVFAFSYLRSQNLKVKVTKKQLRKRIYTLLNDESPFQHQ